MAGKICRVKRKTGRLGQGGRKDWHEKYRLYKKEDRQAAAGRQERLTGNIGCIRRKTGKQRQAGRKGWQEK